MNNNYDCIHDDALPVIEDSSGLYLGHASVSKPVQQPELDASARIEKLIFNKEKFLRTDFGKALKECAVHLDSVVAGLWNYLMDSDERLKMQRQLDLRLAQWDVYQAAMQQFYGLKLCFMRTDKYFGVCTEDEAFWLFRTERVIL